MSSAVQGDWISLKGVVDHQHLDSGQEWRELGYDMRRVGEAMGDEMHNMKLTLRFRKMMQRQTMRNRVTEKHGRTV